MADEHELVIVAIADHLFNRSTLIEAGRLAKSAPEQLTDLHLRHLACYATDHELAVIVKRRADAIEAEDDAFRAKVYAAQQRAVADASTALRHTPAPSVPNFTVRGGDYHTTAITDRETTPLEGMTLKTLCATYPDTPVTLGTLGHLAEFVDAMNEKNKLRNSRLDSLETANQKLQERILELEASAAAVRP